jgi:2-methylcitrate dehydratase
VVAQMMGLTRDEIINAVSLAWVDGQSLRTYRHAPNTGSRKSWAAGDATSRAVRLALIAKTGRNGATRACSAAPTWGFYDVLFKGQPFRFQRPYGSYVMENVLFKISFPAEFHSQTAVEAAMTLHGQLRATARRRQTSSASPSARTRPASASSTRRAAEQPGGPRPLHPVHGGGAAAFGRLTAADYEDEVAHDRASTRCASASSAWRPAVHTGLPRPEKRSIANALTVQLNDGTCCRSVRGIPIGHSAGARTASRCWSASSASTWSGASRRSSRTRSSRRARRIRAGGDAGERVRRSVRRIMSTRKTLRIAGRCAPRRAGAGRVQCAVGEVIEDIGFEAIYVTVPA